MRPQEYPAAFKVYCVLKIILIPALKGHAWEKPESISIDLWQAHRGLPFSPLINGSLYMTVGIMFLQFPPQDLEHGITLSLWNGPSEHYQVKTLALRWFLMKLCLSKPFKNSLSGIRITRSAQEILLILKLWCWHQAGAIQEMKINTCRCSREMREQLQK